MPTKKKGTEKRVGYDVWLVGSEATVVAAVLACLKIPGNKCNKNYS